MIYSWLRLCTNFMAYLSPIRIYCEIVDQVGQCSPYPGWIGNKSETDALGYLPLSFKHLYHLSFPDCWYKAKVLSTSIAFDTNRWPAILANWDTRCKISVFQFDALFSTKSAGPFTTNCALEHWG